MKSLAVAIPLFSDSHSSYVKYLTVSSDQTFVITAVVHHYM